MSRLYVILAVFTALCLSNVEARAQQNGQLGIDGFSLQSGLELIGSFPQSGSANVSGVSASSFAIGSGVSAMAASLSGTTSALFDPASSTLDLSLGAAGQSSLGSLFQSYFGALPASSASASLSGSLNQLFTPQNLNAAQSFSSSNLFSFLPAASGQNGAGLQAGSLSTLSVTLPVSMTQGSAFLTDATGGGFTFSASGFNFGE